MLDQNLINKLVKDEEGYTKKARTYLHENPEKSGEEVGTSKYLKEAMKDLGLNIIEASKTGFYAILDTKREGKVIGLRTDIDALPLEEAERNLSQKRKLISKNKGVFHACGHDGHMAILLTTAKILVSMKDKLNGKVIFIFEQGEEDKSGIDDMIKALRPIHIYAIYGSHMAPFLETGSLSFDKGPVMAGCGEVDINIKGKSGHGSRPDEAINPIFVATSFLENLSTAWVNRLDVTKTVTLGIGEIHAGSAPNIIPEEALIRGTLRYFDEEEGKKALELIRQVGEHTALAHQAEFRADSLFQANRPVINDENLSSYLEEELRENDSVKIVKDKIWFASETFESYENLAPSLFAFVGTKNLEKGTGAAAHNIHFDLDDDALAVGIKAMLTFALGFLFDNN